MFKRVSLRHQSGMTKKFGVGVSWLSFFFGPIIPLVNLDLIGLILYFVILMFTFGIGHFIFPFIYNKNRIKRFLEKGYRPTTAEDAELLKRKGIINAL